MSPESNGNDPDLRTLVLTPDFPPGRGGIQLVMARLVANLPGARTAVVTFGAPGAGEVDAAISAEVVRVASGGGQARKLAVVRLNAGALRASRRFRPDVVISAHPLTAPAAAAIRAPTLQYAHADEFRHRPRLARFAMRRAAAVIAVSAYARELAVAVGAGPDGVHVVHPGVDPPATHPAAAEPGPPTILTVARMAPHKGHDVMLDALPMVRERVPDALWVVIGDGPQRGDLELRAAQLGVADAVRFLGAVTDSERDAWMARANVFAMPSRIPPEGIGGEGFGVVFLEAAAAGLPVVAPSVGGPVDAVVDGETGVLVDPTDAGALAAALARLLADPAWARRLGAAGERRAREFTWGRHVQAVTAIARTLVDAGGPTR